MATTPITLYLTQLNQNMVIVDPATGKPSAAYVQNYNNMISNILVFANAIAGQQANTDALVQQILTLNGYVVDVNGKLDGASITNSYTNPTSTLTATYDGTTGTINIAAHQRIYTDGKTVNVLAGSLTGFAADSYQYIYYMDAARAGGAVTYMASTDATQAAQVGGRHSLNGVQIPNTTGGSSGGDGSVPPGTGGGRTGRNPNVNIE